MRKTTCWRKLQRVRRLVQQDEEIRFLASIIRHLTEGHEPRCLADMGIGWSMHKNGGWRGQLDRVRRWHNRLVSAAETGGSDLEDFAWAFFQNCYHLREWIEKTGGIDRRALDHLFTTDRELRLCRDICNGSKHLTISRPSIDANFSVGREYDPTSTSGHRLFVIADDKDDLLAVSNRCLKAWEDFVSVHLETS